MMVALEGLQWPFSQKLEVACVNFSTGFHALKRVFPWTSSWEMQSSLAPA